MVKPQTVGCKPSISHTPSHSRHRIQGWWIDPLDSSCQLLLSTLRTSKTGPHHLLGLLLGKKGRSNKNLHPGFSSSPRYLGDDDLFGHAPAGFRRGHLPGNHGIHAALYRRGSDILPGLRHFRCPSHHLFTDNEG